MKSVVLLLSLLMKEFYRALVDPKLCSVGIHYIFDSTQLVDKQTLIENGIKAPETLSIHYFGNVSFKIG